MTALGSLQTAPLDVEMEMQTNVDGVEVETVRGIYTEMEMNMEMEMRERDEDGNGDGDGGWFCRQ